MSDFSKEMIQRMGTRSSVAIFIDASFFAIFGGVASIVGSFARVPLFWGVWIPLCFLVIPTIYFLCREFLRLQERVRELEKRLEQR